MRPDPIRVAGKSPFLEILRCFSQCLLLGKRALVRHGALLGTPGSTAFLAPEFLDGLGFGRGLAVGDGVELVAKLAAGEEAVHLTGAFDLALDGDAAGFVLQEDAVRGLVDLLPACTGAADEFLE